MNVNDFEVLKKKQETLSMAKTRVEMKIESLTKEMKECENKLKEQGITDLENIDSVLESMKNELDSKYTELLNQVNHYEENKDIPYGYHFFRK